MCVPTLRQSGYRLLCCLASLQSKIYHCRSVEMLRRSMVVYSGREDLDNTVPPPWERIRSVPASMERHSQTPLVSFRPEKQKGRVPDCCTSSTGADRKPTPPRDQHVSGPQRLVGGKDLVTKHAGPSRGSSLRGALCFFGSSHCSPDGEMFLRDDKRDFFAVTGLFWQDSFGGKELVENCWALRKHH